MKCEYQLEARTVQSRGSLSLYHLYSPCGKFLSYISKCIQYAQINPKFNIFSTSTCRFLCLSHHYLFPSFCNIFLKGLFSLLPPSLSSVYLKHKSKNKPTKYKPDPSLPFSKSFNTSSNPYNDLEGPLHPALCDCPSPCVC